MALSPAEWTVLWGIAELETSPVRSSFDYSESPDNAGYAHIAEFAQPLPEFIRTLSPHDLDFRNGQLPA